MVPTTEQFNIALRKTYRGIYNTGHGNTSVNHYALLRQECFPGFVVNTKF